MERRPQRVVTGAIIGLTALTTALLYPSLPAEMATHWNAAGEVDGAMPKPVGAFLLPAVTLVTVGLMYLAPSIEPRKENFEAFRGAYEWFVAGYAGFLSYLQALIVAWNFGVTVPIERAVPPALAALIYGIGLLLVRVESNGVIGIRTPWTLADEEIWRRTHEHGAIAFKIAGVLTLGGAVFPELFLVFVLGPVLAASAYAVGYSLVAHRRKHRDPS